MDFLRAKYFPLRCLVILGLITCCQFFIKNQAHCQTNQAKHYLSIFGDVKYGQDFKHFDYVNPRAPKRGEVKFGIEGSFNNLNKFLLKGISAAGLDYIYDSLMVASSDEISSYYGLIASSVEKRDNYLEFNLRKIARFHDGRPITSDDVIFTFDILRSKGHPYYQMAFRDIREVKKINTYKVRFILKNSQNRDLPLAIASTPILPKHYYDKTDFTKTTLQPPLGSGPYKISSVKINQSISYERVKDYWAKDLAVNKGRYNFDQLIFDYYRDKNVLVEAFKGQQYDFRLENTARTWANAYNIDAVKNGEIIKKEIRHFLPAPMQAFIFNLRREKFQNLHLRKAINYAFNFEWLKKNIFYGSYKRTESYFANSEFSLNHPKQKFSLPKSTDNYNRENLIKAQTILESAGYKIIDSQLIDPKTNKPIEIEFLITNDSFNMVIAPFIKNLKKIGITAKIKKIEENQYQSRVNNFDYDVMVAVLPQSKIPGDELYAYFHSSQKDVKGSRNLMGLNNKKVDQLVEKITKAKKLDRLKELSKALDQELLKNHYLIPQWHNNSYRILYRDIFNMPKVKPKYGLNIDSWWSKE